MCSAEVEVGPNQACYLCCSNIQITFLLCKGYKMKEREYTAECVLLDTARHGYAIVLYKPYRIRSYNLGFFTLYFMEETLK